MSSKGHKVKLGDIVDIFTGYPFKSAEYSENPDDIKLIRGDNIAQGTLRWDGVKRWPIDKAEGLENFLLKENDVLLAMDRPWIPAGLKFARVYSSDLPCLLVQRVACLRAKSGQDQNFIYSLLSTPAFSEYIQNVTTGTAVPHISVKQIKEFELEKLSLETEKEVGFIHEIFESRIKLLRETNATLEAIAQALFKSWFVDFEPVHANAGTQAPSLPPEIQALFPATFTDSPQGPIPDGWVASVLGDICNNNGGFIQTGPFGSQLHAEDYIPVGTPVVMPKDIVNRRVEPLSTAKIGESDVSRLARHQLQPGDIVFSRRGDVEKHALIGAIESGWICGTGCLLVRPGMKCLSPSFISRALDLPTTRQWLVRHAVGATMPNLNTGILAAVPMIQPNPDVSIAFDKLVGEIDFGISHNLEKIRTLTILRDTLLPRLISGLLRLHATEQMEAS